MARYLCGLTSVASDLLHRGHHGAILQSDNLVYNTCVAELQAGEHGNGDEGDGEHGDGGEGDREHEGSG